jgi:hypothetical protein
MRSPPESVDSVGTARAVTRRFITLHEQRSPRRRGERLREATERDARKARAILEEAMVEAFEVTFPAHRPPALSAPVSE